MIKIKDINQEQYNIISSRTNGKCFYCGNEVTSDYHYHNINNEGLVLSCSRCHELKGNKTQEEFKKYLWGLFNQVKNSSLYSILFDVGKVSEINKEINFYGEKIDKSLKRIKKTICLYFNINEEDVDKKTRKRKIVVPRQIAHYIALLNTKHSLTDIGKEIGNKNHATVLNSKKTINNLIDTDPDFKKELKNISQKYNYKI
jgi:hypothetical protein